MGDYPDPPSLRFLINRLLRQDELCNGGSAMCPMANQMICDDCGAEQQGRNADCLECGSYETTTLPCSSCPVARIHELRQTSDAGKMLSGVMEFDFATSSFQVDWSDVPAKLAKGIQILKQERDRHTTDQIADSKKKQQQQQIDWNKVKKSQTVNKPNGR